MMEFQEQFKALTGRKPLSWQVRLYEQHFAKGLEHLPKVIDLPTGLGKTMVMAIWLIARANHQDKVPTRLIYVVDRRTVVDQATELAEDLQRNFGKDKLAISTLRGQMADNREWSRDPSRPAIIIGTVDLIGSALLFSGYRSSYIRRPLEAGLLGQDSLLVLDEAHLSKPFEKLLRSIERLNSSKDVGLLHVKPMQVIRMSATTGETTDTKAPFTLKDEDASDDTIKNRYGAKKRLMKTTLAEKAKVADKLTEEAIKLAENTEVIGKRIVVFVRKPDDARTIAEKIRSHGETKKTPGPYHKAVEVLTGTMRGLERDKLVEKEVFEKRWLNGDLDPNDPVNQTPVFLISTSAGEVGFDLNADHMVCDATTIDSLIQRLGRVNRRGTGNAQIHLIAETPKKEKEGKPKKLDELDLAIANTLKLLEGITDVSPKNIAALKAGVWQAVYSAACTPPVPTMDLTDILLDHWSMTSIRERMPGRPEVGPWLRGNDDKLPQTSIAWRAELELVKDHPEQAKALQKIFSKHRLRPHELVTVNSYQVVEFLKQATKLKDRPESLPKTQLAIRMTNGQVTIRSIEKLIDDPAILNAEPTLILPATFGGLDTNSGMLDAEAIPKIRQADDTQLTSLDEADHDNYEQREDAPARLRLVIQRTEVGWQPKQLPGGVAFADRISLKDLYATSTDLFKDLRKSGLRIRLVQPVTIDDEGETVQSQVMLTAPTRLVENENETLTSHVSKVVAEATRIADALGWEPEHPFRMALLFAAKWHDEGKKDDVWQRYACRDKDADFKGKTSKTLDPQSLRGYRHELGSLLRMQYPGRCATTSCELPATDDIRELALHMIAIHHGMGRPHFEPTVYSPFTSVERDSLLTEVIQRFARLQRQNGWWQLAWLENLLRCADANASADQDAEDEGAES